MEEEKANANSEIRYLALELTKIAVKQKKPFASVASDFVKNVYELQSILKNTTNAGVPSRNKQRVVDYGRQKKR